MNALAPKLLEQLKALRLDANRPLIVSDADGVLLQFIEQMEQFLDARNLWLDLSSYRLGGNIKHKDTNIALPMDDMPALIETFFAEETDKLSPIMGAAQALNTLSKRAQIVILSNLPAQYRDARSRNLLAHGMAYPVLAGEGPKGPAIAWLQQSVQAPLIFLDDIHFHLDSAAEHAPDSKRIHFIGHTRLAELAPQAKSAHIRVHDWMHAQNWIADTLTASGY